jgi:hypothetical protein
MVPLPSCCILPPVFSFQPAAVFAFLAFLVASLPRCLFSSSIFGKNPVYWLSEQLHYEIVILGRYHVILTVVEKQGEITLRGSYFH